MVDQLQPAQAPTSPKQLRRLIRAVLASTLTGLVVYVMVMRVALPTLAARLSPQGIEWLRGTWERHPFWVLATIVAGAALSGLPVLAAFRLAYGPFPKRDPHDRP